MCHSITRDHNRKRPPGCPPPRNKWLDHTYTSCWSTEAKAIQEWRSGPIADYANFSYYYDYYFMKFRFSVSLRINRWRHKEVDSLQEEEACVLLSACSNISVQSSVQIPARSTRFMMLVFLLSLLLVLMNWSNVMVTTVCARLLVAFMLVDATVRLAVPAAHIARPLPLDRCIQSVHSEGKFGTGKWWIKQHHGRITTDPVLYTRLTLFGPSIFQSCVFSAPPSGLRLLSLLLTPHQVTRIHMCIRRNLCFQTDFFDFSQHVTLFLTHVGNILALWQFWADLKIHFYRFLTNWSMADRWTTWLVSRLVAACCIVNRTWSNVS